MGEQQDMTDMSSWNFRKAFVGQSDVAGMVWPGTNMIADSIFWDPRMLATLGGTLSSPLNSTQAQWSMQTDANLGFLPSVDSSEDRDGVAGTNQIAAILSPANNDGVSLGIPPITTFSPDPENNDSTILKPRQRKPVGSKEVVSIVEKKRQSVEGEEWLRKAAEHLSEGIETQT